MEDSSGMFTELVQVPLFESYRVVVSSISDGYVDLCSLLRTVHAR